MFKRGKYRYNNLIQSDLHKFRISRDEEKEVNEEVVFDIDGW